MFFLYFVFYASGSAIKYAKSHSAADLMNKTSSGVCINDYNAIAMCTQTIMLILIQQLIYSHTAANSSQMAIIFTWLWWFYFPCRQYVQYKRIDYYFCGDSDKCPLIALFRFLIWRTNSLKL